MLLRSVLFRSRRCIYTKIDASKLIIERTSSPKAKIAPDSVPFGQAFTDHMLVVDWSKSKGWTAPIISSYSNLSLSPACAGVNYGLQCFEGMKAYKDGAGNVRLFRPDMNMRRFNQSLCRLALPPIDEDELINCIKQLVRVDSDWVPSQEGYSLYIRPAAIATEANLAVTAPTSMKLFVILSPVGPYFKDGLKPIRLYADTVNCRAWPGGAGNVKIGGNYSPTILPSRTAMEKHGCSQVLWLFGTNRQITEVGAMNICFVIKSEDGSCVELVTPPLDGGDILPGVTRNSVLEIARQLGHTSSGARLVVQERVITLDEVKRVAEENRLLEVFGCGTAALLCPVECIVTDEFRIAIPVPSIDMQNGSDSLMSSLSTAIVDIQYGRVPHLWSIAI